LHNDKDQQLRFTGDVKKQKSMEDGGWRSFLKIEKLAISPERFDRSARNLRLMSNGSYGTVLLLKYSMRIGTKVSNRCSIIALVFLYPSCFP